MYNLNLAAGKFKVQPKCCNCQVFEGARLRIRSRTVVLQVYANKADSVGSADSEIGKPEGW